MRLKSFKKEKEISKETIKKNMPLLLIPLVIGVIGITYLVSSFAFYNYEVEDAQLINAKVGDFASPGTLIAKNSSSDTSSFWKYSDKVTSVEFLSDTNKQEIVVPEAAVESFDVSVEKNETIKAWVVDDESDANTYKLYFQGKNKIIFNENSSYLFYNFTKATSITGLENVDTSNVTDMSYMFDECKSLTSLDLSTFDVSKVEKMMYIFGHYFMNLEYLNVSNWNFHEAITSNCIFSNLSNLKQIILTNVNTSKMNDMSLMFSNCSSLTQIDVSSFDTSNVTNMEGMFSGCNGLINLDLSTFDTSKVTNIASMFESCTSLIDLDLSNFNIINVYKIGNLFKNCSKVVTTLKFAIESAHSGGDIFLNAATSDGAKIILNYTSSSELWVNFHISQQSTNGNVVKGILVS